MSTEKLTPERLAALEEKAALVAFGVFLEAAHKNVGGTKQLYNLQNEARYAAKKALTAASLFVETLQEAQGATMSRHPDQKKGQPVPASPKQNDQAPITAPHQDSTPAVQEVKP